MTVNEFVDLVRALRELGATRVEAHGFVAVLPGQAPAVHAPKTNATEKRELNDDQRFEAALQSELF